MKKRKRLKEKLPDEPMNLEQFAEWTGNSPQRFIRLIGEFATASKPDCQTVEQWNVFLRRNLRAATQLAPFTDEQIDRAYGEVVSAGYITKFGLETILKFLIK